MGLGISTINQNEFTNSRVSNPLLNAVLPQTSPLSHADSSKSPDFKVWEFKRLLIASCSHASGVVPLPSAAVLVRMSSLHRRVFSSLELAFRRAEAFPPGRGEDE